MDRSGILSEWNEEVDAHLEEGLVEDEVVPYPSITAKFPGVELERDTPTAAIKDELELHGRPKDAAAHNAGILLHDIVAARHRRSGASGDHRCPHQQD